MRRAYEQDGRQVGRNLLPQRASDEKSENDPVSRSSFTEIPVRCLRVTHDASTKKNKRLQRRKSNVYKQIFALKISSFF